VLSRRWLAIVLLFSIPYTIIAGFVPWAIPQPTPADPEPTQAEIDAAAPWDPHILREPWITEDPQAGFAFVHIWQQYGHTFPDALLKKVVEAAFRPEAPWEHTKAGNTARRLLASGQTVRFMDTLYLLLPPSQDTPLRSRSAW